MPITPKVDEAVLNQVQRDLFGETGKDGALAKVGFELALLYRLYQDDLQGQGQAHFVSPYPGMRLQDGYVLIDATATSEAAALLEDLEALGLKDGIAFGRVVSGRLPILAIEEVATLPTLLSARAAMPVR